MLACDKCHSAIPSNAKFCSQCGDPVTDADVQKIAVTGVPQVIISFGESSSANYSRALSICQKIPTFETESGEQVRHKLVLPLTEVELIANIFDLVGNWKSSSMMINGSLATKKDLTYFGVGCYRARQKAYAPQQYCFGERSYEANIWGCKRLNMAINEWGGGWIDFGKFDSEGVWHFDKERIRHQLNLALKDVELCPVLNRGRIFETLEKLPDSINPKTDTSWQYRTQYQEVNGEFKEVAIGIRPVIKSVQGYILGDFKPAWPEEKNESPIVSPHSESNLKFISKKNKWKKWLIYGALGLALLYLAS